MSSLLQILLLTASLWSTQAARTRPALSSAALLQTTHSKDRLNLIVHEDHPVPVSLSALQALSGVDHNNTASTQAHKTRDLEPEFLTFASFVTTLVLLPASVYLQRQQQALPVDDESAAGGSKHSFLLDNAKAVAIFCVIYGHFLYPIMTGEWSYDGETWLKYAEPNEARSIFSLLPASMPLFCFVSGVCSQGPPNRRRVKSFLLTLVLPSIMWSFPVARILERLSAEPTSLTYWPKEGLYFFVCIEWYLPSLILWRCATYLFFHHLHPAVLLLLAQAISCSAGYFRFGGIFGVESAFWQITSMGTTLGYLPYFVSGYICNFNGICKSLPPLGWPWRLAAFGVLTWLPKLSSVMSQNPTDPHFGYEITNSSQLEIGWLFWSHRVVKWAADMVSMALLLFVVLPRSETWFSWMGKYTLYPYLLHHQLFLTPRGQLVSHLPLPPLTSYWARLAVLLGHAPLCVLGEAFMSSWPVRWALKPIFDPKYLEPAVDLLVGTPK